MPSRPRFRPHQHQQVAGGAGRRPHQAIVMDGAQTEGVHQRIALVGWCEVDLPADVRHADAVAVAGDASNHPMEEVAAPG